jgi:hypothetical protein
MGLGSSFAVLETLRGNNPGFAFDLATPRKCKVSRCDHGDSNAPKNWRFSKCNEGIRTMSINPTFEEQLVEQLRSIEINNDLEHDVYF